MSEKKQTQQQHHGKQTQPRNKPTPDPKQVGGQVDSDELIESLLTTTGDASQQGYAAQFGDTRLQTPQRQAMARQIGQIHGNQYLQRVMVQMKQNEESQLRQNQIPPLSASDSKDSTENVLPADQVQQNGQSGVLPREGDAVVQRNPLSGALDWVSDRIGDWTDSRPDEARLDAQEELADFMKEKYELKNHHPSTGIGLFNAAYDPQAGRMTVTVKIHFNMTNGNPADPEWVAAVGGPVEAAKYTPDQFQWQGDEADDWKQRAISDAQNFWGNRYTFYTTQPYWDSLPPVNVGINVVEAPATSGNADEMAHFVVRVRKWPTDGGRGGSVEESITSPGAGSNRGTGRFEEMGGDAGGVGELDVRDFTRTTRTRAKYGEADTDNPRRILFDQGSSDVSAADKTKLKKFGETLGKPYMPPFDVTITGHSSSEGTEENNLTLSEDRAREVSNEIVSAGAKKQPLVEATGEAGADETPGWRRVDITVGKFQASQRTVMHEFGHIFGLGDEYPSADDGSRTVGTEVAHSDMAERLIPGQQPVVAHHNENIMSNGEMMRPHHYVTFLEVLGKMTDTEGKWDVRPYNFAGVRGDFPTRQPDDPTYA